MILALKRKLHPLYIHESPTGYTHFKKGIQEEKKLLFYHHPHNKN